MPGKMLRSVPCLLESRWTFGVHTGRRSTSHIRPNIFTEWADMLARFSPSDLPRRASSGKGPQSGATVSSASSPSWRSRRASPRPRSALPTPPTSPLNPHRVPPPAPSRCGQRLGNNWAPKLTGASRRHAAAASMPAGAPPARRCVPRAPACAAVAICGRTSAAAGAALRPSRSRGPRSAPRVPAQHRRA